MSLMDEYVTKVSREISSLTNKLRDFDRRIEQVEEREILGKTKDELESMIYELEEKYYALKDQAELPFYEKVRSDLVDMKKEVVIEIKRRIINKFGLHDSIYTNPFLGFMRIY